MPGPSVAIFLSLEPTFWTFVSQASKYPKSRAGPTVGHECSKCRPTSGTNPVEWMGPQIHVTAWVAHFAGGSVPPPRVMRFCSFPLFIPPVFVIYFF